MSIEFDLHCPTCLKSIRLNDRFCIYCGRKFVHRIRPNAQNEFKIPEIPEISQEITNLVEKYFSNNLMTYTKEEISQFSSRIIQNFIQFILYSNWDPAKK